MSTFIDFADYKTSINDDRLNQIINNDNSILDEAESTAIAKVKHALNGQYDVNQIFNKVGNARDKEVLNWVRRIVLYLIYERVPDKMMPSRVENNYNETVDWLKEVAKGKVNLDLPIKIKADGEEKTHRRWGSVPKRSNNPYDRGY